MKIDPLESKRILQQFDRKIVRKSSLERNESLSEQYNANIYLKREDLQLVRSFKIRWAYAKMMSLSDDEKKKWIVAASAWNHAQWVALSCSKLGITWTIFMPMTTPAQKVRKTKKFWNWSIQVKLEWDTFNDAYDAAKAWCDERGAVFVHPFNDEKVIAGQGTLWREIIDQMWEKKIDMILIAVGWWWLLAWVGSIMKELSPWCEIIWVESAWSASMSASLQQGEEVELWSVDTFADGVAVKQPGEITFGIAKEIVDEMIVVDDGWTATAMLRLLDDQWIITEPAWALSVAALEQIKEKIIWKNVVCITCGGNFDFSRLQAVEEKSLRYLGLKRYFIVTFPQRPWALREFLEVLWPDDDIVRFEYMKKTTKEWGPALVWLQSTSKDNFDWLIARMQERWISFEDITEKEVYFDLLV